MNYFISAIGTDSGKSLISAILVEALRADYWKSIQAGERFVDPFIPYAICHRDPRDAQALSDRERMVLTLLCDGMTNKEIAEELCIAETTARGHVQSIMRKLNVKDRTAAAVEGIRRHWVD